MIQKTLSHYQSDGWDCPTCGRMFDTEGGMKAHHNFAHDKSISGLLIVCDWCGDLSRKKRSATEKYENVYCSMECRDKSRSKHYRGESHHMWKGGDVEIECEVCGGTTTVRPAYGSEQRFCSTECQGVWYSETLYGSNHPKWEGGYTRTQSVRKALGEKSWSQIRRDNASEQCYMCGETENLQLHHIIPIRSGGTHDLRNLMTLCVSCHATVERYTDEFTEDILFKYENSHKQHNPKQGGARE